MIVLASSAPAMAQLPVLPVQGTLRETAGNLVDGTRDVTFKLYRQDKQGDAFYTVTKPVAFDMGRFVTYLGDQKAVPADPELNEDDFEALPEVWLGITISLDTEMTPPGAARHVALCAVCAAMR
jgi:hypothetical protein